MEYRIKIISFDNYSKLFVPQVKIGFFSGWCYIDSYGNNTKIESGYISREEALDNIHRHIAKHPKVKSIDYENLK